MCPTPFLRSQSVPLPFRRLVLSTDPLSLWSDKMIVSFTRSTITLNTIHVTPKLTRVFDSGKAALYEIHSIMMEWVQDRMIKKRPVQFYCSYGVTNQAFSDDVNRLLQSADTAAISTKLASSLSLLCVR